MSLIITDEQNYKDIADAIREKNSETSSYAPEEMANKIRSLSGAAAPNIQSITISKNGTYYAKDGVNGYSPITVQVPGTVSPGGAINPFSKIEVKSWTPSSATTFYHVENYSNLAFVAMFCQDSLLSSQYIHSLFIVTDLKYKANRYGLPTGSLFRRSNANTSGYESNIVCFNQPNVGDISEDNQTFSFKGNTTYIVVLGYGPL